jgi:hypothetical protein
MALDASLAIVVNADPEEQDRAHRFCACVHDTDDGCHRPIADLSGEFLALAPSASIGQRINVPMAFDLRGMGIPKPGDYELRVCIDDEVLATLAFHADADH